ncbi:MAG TPA: ACP S-malonyltransferase [Thermoanaerobaculia bacterium]|nr:ACP S-malonyltransferase [Thermoanaerobaculia bacterium]HQR66615.1 ACP S-malonyltransferase [Thermoanaerobaculia bacterium]
MVRGAFLFPGQGSQFAGMGKDLAAAYPEARAVYERADAALAALGLSVSTVSFEGTDEELRQTAVTQPAIVTHSVAVFEVLKARGAAPQIAAGHSLGEYAALVAAGALTLEEAVVLVRRRGLFMQEAVPAGAGAMSAVIGLPPEAVAAACAGAEAETGETCAAANFNSPEQTVIAGTARGVARAAELLKGAGAKRVLPLPVSAPFHCALMKAAEEKLAPYLDATPFRPMTFPVVTNVDATPNRDPGAAREALKRQVCSAVRWVESVGALSGAAPAAVECGPGTVLAGLAKRIVRDWPVVSTSDAAGVAKLLGA